MLHDAADAVECSKSIPGQGECCLKVEASRKGEKVEKEEEETHKPCIEARAATASAHSALHTVDGGYLGRWWDGSAHDVSMLECVKNILNGIFRNTCDRGVVGRFIAASIAL